MGLLQNLAPHHMRSMFIAVAAGGQCVQFHRRAAGHRLASATGLPRAWRGCGVAALGRWLISHHRLLATWHAYRATKTVIGDQKRAVGYGQRLGDSG